jgi:hypothetical protein
MANAPLSGRDGGEYAGVSGSDGNSNIFQMGLDSLSGDFPVRQPASPCSLSNKKTSGQSNHCEEMSRLMSQSFKSIEAGVARPSTVRLKA